jgi:hypothetical protein
VPVRIVPPHVVGPPVGVALRARVRVRGSVPQDSARVVCRCTSARAAVPRASLQETARG